MTFTIRDEKGWVIKQEQFITEGCKSVMYACPFRAATIE
jgi:hypothetical protein